VVEVADEDDRLDARERVDDVEMLGLVRIFATVSSQTPKNVTLALSDILLSLLDEATSIPPGVINAEVADEDDRLDARERVDDVEMLGLVRIFGIPGVLELVFDTVSSQTPKNVTLALSDILLSLLDEATSIPPGGTRPCVRAPIPCCCRRPVPTRGPCPCWRARSCWRGSSTPSRPSSSLPAPTAPRAPARARTARRDRTTTTTRNRRTPNPVASVDGSEDRLAKVLTDVALEFVTRGAGDIDREAERGPAFVRRFRVVVVVRSRRAVLATEATGFGSSKWRRRRRG
jgi:hypothetical protein